ncbi:hypothetical protein TrVE_jg10817 [Triparma verrucosa]|uniref:Clp ATPase C-terminal domain-containing protein n=1 Tax=Triparma verrucosa TaxID=1606542 RepID=A0A9W7EU58_9STRA|nr:hypothetical protein TrVE_jg10817 [Triparma verrucosa]
MERIVGQADAKRAVAIALRNRWRRKQLPENFKTEVIPKNILMIGPTGCGKTEIARHLAKLSQAPFIKVEATKFTEVGFHGRDVDQIIRDLLDVSINLTKKRKTELMREEDLPSAPNTATSTLITSSSLQAARSTRASRELQGRLPIRVELQGLTEDDMYRILTEPITNMIRQQVELLSTEGVELVFEDDAVREIARMAALLNKTVENIGARRLHTVVERIVEELSFQAPEMEDGAVITVTKDLVKERVSDMLVESDLSRFIL